MFENTTVILHLIVLVFYLNYSLSLSLSLACMFVRIVSWLCVQDLLSYTKVWAELMDVHIWESSVYYMQYKGNVGQDV